MVVVVWICAPEEPKEVKSTKNKLFDRHVKAIGEGTIA